MNSLLKGINVLWHVQPAEKMIQKIREKVKSAQNKNKKLLLRQQKKIM